MKATDIIIPTNAPERDMSAVVAGAAAPFKTWARDSLGAPAPHILHIGA